MLALMRVSAPGGRTAVVTFPDPLCLACPLS